MFHHEDIILHYNSIHRGNFDQYLHEDVIAKELLAAENESATMDIFTCTSDFATFCTVCRRECKCTGKLKAEAGLGPLENLFQVKQPPPVQKQYNSFNDVQAFDGKLMMNGQYDDGRYQYEYGSAPSQNNGYFDSQVSGANYPVMSTDYAYAEQPQQYIEAYDSQVYPQNYGYENWNMEAIDPKQSIQYHNTPVEYPNNSYADCFYSFWRCWRHSVGYSSSIIKCCRLKKLYSSELETNA